MHLLASKIPFSQMSFPIEREFALFEGEIPTAMVICDQGMIWHTGQEGPSAEAFRLDGSKDARDRTLPESDICIGDKKCCSTVL